MAAYVTAPPSIPARLKEIRRRLGPLTVSIGASEPFRVNDADIARRLMELVEIVEELAAKVER